MIYLWIHFLFKISPFFVGLLILNTYLLYIDTSRVFGKVLGAKRDKEALILGGIVASVLHIVIFLALYPHYLPVIQ